MLRLRVSAAIALLAVLSACNPRPVPEAAPDAPERAASALPEDDGCPDRSPAATPLPGVLPEHADPAWWLARMEGDGELDRVLLDVAAIERHNRATRTDGSGLVSVDGVADRDAVLAELAERLAFVAERLDSGAYVDGEGNHVANHGLVPDGAAAGLRLAPEVRLAQSFVQFSCVPLEQPLFTPSLDRRFDRNHCSGARAHEPVEVLAEWPAGWWLVRTGYTLGFVPLAAPLTRALTQAEIDWIARSRVATAERATVLATRAGELELEPHAQVRVSPDGLAMVAVGDEVISDVPLEGVAGVQVLPPLTRRNVVEAAFSYLGEPYGWGDDRGGRDCSRFLMDLFGTFGLELPRFSGSQALSGTFSIDLSGVTEPGERTLLMEAAAERGLVLLHFPGHIMLYLGRNDAGRPMAIHAFAEYLEPCSGGEGFEGRPETLREVDRIIVSDLTLGEGTSRGAFLDRITRITVLGDDPGAALRGSATLRQAAPVDVPATCPDGLAYTVFHSPRLPAAGERLRFLLTGADDTGPAAVVLRAPDGSLVSPTSYRLGGPPHTWVAEVDAPTEGQWQVVLGDGDRLHACGSARVRARRESADTGPAGGPAWELRGAWGPAYEALWSAFVEKLFDYPVDEDLTWTSLHELLQDPDRNLLFGHLGQDEEARLRLTPDCADLPYFLRAYFAWKVGLPFGYRECSRGRAGRPPSCGGIITNLETRGQPGDVDAFLHFANRRVRNGVHSASGRTVPDDNNTDWYPVGLDRSALAPGTLYADPYGHILMLTRWVDQTQTNYGVLMAADAQPDATVGRRRFWRGTFLFTPDTDSVGAGFKAWRPLVLDERTGALRALTNAEINRSDRYVPHSTQQYEITADGFYDAMDALINPRPLDPWVMQSALIDALEESVVRRVNSVETGESWMRANGEPTVDMPSGAAIFQTSGPWEDFSTPSRDLRLLVAIDAMLAFVGTLERMPERFGLGDAGPDELAAFVADVTARRDAELQRREFVYGRTDRSEWTLSLADVVARQVSFETAYNPNDCPEVRWGAPENSDELSTCRRRRPSAQEPRMQQYREWFAERRRPQP